MKNIHDDNSLAIYINDLMKIPLLTREEEIELAEKARNGDESAKNKLVTANLRFVIKIAKKYQNRGLELEDLISEGNIGLLKAIDHFDISRGYHFISYAVWWVRQSILNAIGEKARAIRLPANRVGELYQIEQIRKNRAGKMSETDEILEIASMLKMNPSCVRDLLNISQEMISFDAPVCSDSDSACYSDFIEDTQNESPEEHVIKNDMKDEIEKVVDTLPVKEAAVLKHRYGLTGLKEKSLKEVGDMLNLSKERIRQIEIKAVQSMKSEKRSSRLSIFVA